MNVQIQERIFSLRAEYDIVSDSGNFFGQKAIFSLGTHIEIRDLAGTTVVTIQTNSLFNIGYSITFADGRIFDFHLQKFWTSLYRCEGPSEPPLTWVQHRGLRWSVLKNDRQVAALTKNAWVVGSGNEYQIAMNHDADMLLIVAMTLAINTASHDDNNDSSITFDFGSLLQDRPYDESWRPT